VTICYGKALQVKVFCMVRLRVGTAGYSFNLPHMQEVPGSSPGATIPNNTCENKYLGKTVVPDGILDRVSL
jgi:hypothetical protein